MSAMSESEALEMMTIQFTWEELDKYVDLFAYQGVDFAAIRQFLKDAGVTPSEIRALITVYLSRGTQIATIATKSKKEGAQELARLIEKARVVKTSGGPKSLTPVSVTLSRIALAYAPITVRIASNPSLRLAYKDLSLQCPQAYQWPGGYNCLPDDAIEARNDWDKWVVQFNNVINAKKTAEERSAALQFLNVTKPIVLIPNSARSKIWAKFGKNYRMEDKLFEFK